MADSVEENQNNENIRRNRKRKKSFLKNARKYGKKGHFGRGSNLTEDKYQYFVQVLDIYRNNFESDEEKQIFVDNVFEQTVGEEVNISCNQIGCRVIETLLPFANNETLERYIQVFNDDLRPLLSDQFASHVIQKLLCLTAKKGIKKISIQSENNEEPDTKKEDNKIHIDKCFNFALKISKFLLNNLEDYVWDRYANHIMRTAIISLAGIFKEDTAATNAVTKVIGKNTEIKVEKSELPDEYVEVVKDFAERLMKWPQFGDLAYDQLTSGLLQSFLPALAVVSSKLHKSILKKMINECFVGSEDIEPDKLVPVFESEAAMRLLETALEHSVPKYYTQMYAKCFVGHLPVLANQKSTNFAVQKLLNNCTEKVEFEAMFDELSDQIENILISGFTGVILSLAQGCLRLNAKQGGFVQSLMTALHCYKPDEKQNMIVPLTLKLVPLERYENTITETYFVNLHGSIIVQKMLEFHKPIKIISSILNMEISGLKNLFCDPKGCHLMDSYMNSQYVGEKSREKLIRKLQGIYQDLASHKYGSRSFDNIWEKTNLKQKIHIMDELLDKLGSWSSTNIGQIIANKINVTLYKSNKELWKQNLNKANTAKTLFADILDVK